MYKHVSLSLLLLLPLSTLYASEISNSELLQEIESLKQNIKTLETKQVENSNAIEAVEDFSEETETRVLEDKLKFGLWYKTSLDNFTRTSSDGSKSYNSNIWSNKVMLKMRADITDNMKFTARLSMNKYWGASNIHPISSIDNFQGRYPSDSGIYVERAYLDWYFNKDGYIPMAVTLGRQPGGDGPSHQFKDNVSRKSTYSALLYDTTGDGLITTFDMSKLLHNQKSYLRLAYVKAFGYAERFYPPRANFVTTTDNSIKDSNTYALFFDTSIPTLKRSLIQLSYGSLRDLNANDFDSNTTTNTNLGNISFIGAMAEVTNIKESNLDLFVHYGFSKTEPNSDINPYYGSLLNSTDSKEGQAIWVGGRYGFGANEQFKIGLEYNYGTENWINLTQGADDLYNKLTTRGSVYEGYLMYVINRYSNLRLGFIQLDYDYTGSGMYLGEPVAIENVSNAPLQTKQLQSVYLKMSVNF